MRERALLVTGTQGAPLYLAIAAFFLMGMRQNLTVPLSFGLSIGQFLLFLCGALWALTRLRGDRSQIRNRALTCAVLLYVLVSLLSYASAMGRGIPQSAVAYSDQYIFITLGLVAMTFAVMAMITTTDGLLLVLKGLLVGGWVSASFAIIQFLTGIDLAPQFRLPGLKSSDFVLVRDLMREGIVRPQGSAGHPLELAAVLTTLVPIGLGVIASARAKGEKSWPWMLCTVTLLSGAVVTVSRSVFLGLAAAVVVMAWRWPIQRLAATFAGVFVVACLAWLLQLKVVTAFASSFAFLSSDDPSIASRSTGINYVLTHYHDHFWLGQGAGTYPAYRDQPVLDSEYLSRLIDTGVLGFSVYIVLLFVAMALALRASAAAAPVNAAIGAGLSGAIAVVMAIGAILDISGFIQCSLLAWFIIALSPVAMHVSRQGETPPDHPSDKEVGCVGAREPPQ